MNMLKAMNDALRYVEEHLAEMIDLQEAARLAVCSEYHLQRMFSFLAGIPLSEYIRRRRLTLAAFELEGSAARVIDVAVKYGYGSADSFARAFQAWHGVLPSEARAGGHALRAFSPMTFQLAVTGGAEMKVRIIDKEPFRIVGITRRVPIVFNGVNPDIEAMWKSLDADTIRTMKELSDIEPQGIISASVNFDDGRMEERGALDHYIGAATTKACPEHLAQLEAAASTWAVFEAAGPFPKALQEVWGRIYSEWFPSSNYELVEGPEILWNADKDTSLPNYRSEIWVPVKRRG
ncbi:AraC family transcriptional regulator [Cohnella lubricantis]|uniref:AraC family transcriptional regulator n=1 Tax=Cohnella lubricantis TaxID=2163172 RepID=A0A841TFF5_9BACL|nr:AraC family transcriptional regulator [Cohnella lubricantis]MBB6678018.1 AraC family transcriptional regulator [Cohnella lubricantis]MBP2118147.1 AraC family transcriptional regulator [Cohnella lubricantis]